MLIRAVSQVMHSIMGGTAVFCLIYAAIIPDSGWLLIEGGEWGILAWIVLFFQCKYLEQ